MAPSTVLENNLSTQAMNKMALMLFDSLPCFSIGVPAMNMYVNLQ